MRASLVVVLVAAMLATASQQKDDNAKKDRDKLQGTWTSIEGPPFGRLTIAGEKITLARKEGDSYKEMAKGTFKLDPSRTPKTIDITVSDHADQDKYKGKTSLGIYELDGDQLKWCAAEPGKEDRPKKFALEEPYFYTVLKRDKP